MRPPEHLRDRPTYQTWQQALNARALPNPSALPVPDRDLVLLLWMALPMMEELRGKWDDDPTDRAMVIGWWATYYKLAERDRELFIPVIFKGRRCLIAHVNDDVDL
jgi:hypothetical protein